MVLGFACEPLWRESTILIIVREILCGGDALACSKGPDVKTAVVTGGGSGIGLAVVRRLRADGLDVAAIDLKPSHNDLAYTADVTDRAQVDAALSAIRDRLGPVSVLVNAA